ncbi:hypothetical protein ELQ35_07430 [Peribacillus cavernae]|uniref:Uncharacterized protein n=1 Tax=Peribacillus cavernae TaxID=1674310 RepID=A0A3S0W0T9_9BACI|nr:hypothetical protein [Peribacillus cavernae]MDQ0217380.1 hypothetical protein [Peribacillus cavernae]RUQ30171.1 hypothetical protein ELQ35_07430 [Peribacillus cavernae]
MNENILKLRDLFQQLLKLLKNENDSDSLYIIKQVDYSLNLVNDYIDNTNGENDEKNLLSHLRENYQTLNQPRVGLSDYFIWRDNYEEREKANKVLDAIKEDLFQMLGR